LKQAIITGANGLVGYELTKFLLLKNIKLICLGNKKFEETHLINTSLKKEDYINLSMNKINRLPDLFKKKNLNIENECIFYNFAWKGKTKLTDGSLSDQLENAINSAEAVKAAKKVGCSKFINVGTIEESNAEFYLKKNYPKRNSQSQLFYTIAKLSSRDMCSITAYLEKIDYIHTRLSVPLDPTLKKGSYISSTLKKILRSEEYIEPESNQLFDIVFLEDVVRAYFLIGKKGFNKANYFIGTGRPLTLKQYFDYFKKIIKKEYIFPKVKYKNQDLINFSTNSLESDTGFKTQINFKDIKKYIIS